MDNELKIKYFSERLNEATKYLEIDRYISAKRSIEICEEIKNRYNNELPSFLISEFNIIKEKIVKRNNEKRNGSGMFFAMIFVLVSILLTLKYIFELNWLFSILITISSFTMYFLNKEIDEPA